MGGKSVLFLVVGFSLIFLIMGKNFGEITVDAAANYADYYSQTMSKNIAESGANLAVNQIYLNSLWTDGYSNINCDGGKINVAVTIIDPVRNLRQVTSTGIFNGDTSTVQVTLSLSYFSKFAYCSNDENGIWWATGDTVNGPFHTQDHLNVNGHPVFNPGKNGYVSTRQGLNNADWRSSPVLVNTTLRTGDSLAIPTDGVSTVENLATSGGHVFSGHSDVYIVFQNDYLKYSFSTGWHASWTTIKISTLAPNGTIVADNANLHIQGVVQGQVTVAATGIGGTWNYWDQRRGSSGTGNIYLDGDIVYSSDPRSNPNSTDLLGIVAQQNVYVTDNSTNDNGINIDAAIYAEKGGFGAQNYDRRPYSGYINLLGGITQSDRLPVGIIGSNGSISNGFNKSYNYDSRLMYSVPPNFPSTNSYQIVSWYE